MTAAMYMKLSTISHSLYFASLDLSVLLCGELIVQHWRLGSWFPVDVRLLEKCHLVSFFTLGQILLLKRIRVFAINVTSQQQTYEYRNYQHDKTGHKITAYVIILKHDTSDDPIT